MQSVLALMKETDTLDELGIGQVAMCIPMCCFPGFSAIDTRARYFLAIPKIMLDRATLVPSNRRVKSLAQYLSEAKNNVASMLKAN